RDPAGCAGCRPRGEQPRATGTRLAPGDHAAIPAARRIRNRRHARGIARGTQAELVGRVACRTSAGPGSAGACGRGCSVMTPIEVMREIAARGLSLSTDGGDLRLQGPRGRADAALVERIKACKSALIAHLQESEKAFPLTELQRAYIAGR